jgi:ABC-2 type transport system ATP-binding protein
MGALMSSVENKGFVLAVDGISKRYGSDYAINGFSFEINRGEVVGLIGPNGAGKTTMLKCLAGLVKPNAGSIFVKGVAAAQKNPDPGVLSFLFEIDALPNDMLAKNFLLAEAFALGLGKQDVSRVISEVSLDDSCHKTIRTLSMGNKRRVGLAAALLPESELLVLDEPTNGLDLDGLHLIRNLIAQRKKGGTSVLFSSHTMSEVEKVADRVVIIRRGKKLFDGGIDALRSATSLSSLEEAYESVLLGRG